MKASLIKIKTIGVILSVMVLGHPLRSEVPPTLSITYSWAPGSQVVYTNNGVPDTAVNAAIANWNSGLSFYASCAHVTLSRTTGNDSNPLF
jgi:hypothetical protein